MGVIGTCFGPEKVDSRPANLLFCAFSALVDSFRMPVMNRQPITSEIDDAGKVQSEHSHGARSRFLHAPPEALSRASIMAARARSRWPDDGKRSKPCGRSEWRSRPSGPAADDFDRQDEAARYRSRARLGVAVPAAA
jgi:hypothetical protein